MGRQIRQNELHARRVRKMKLKKLRAHYAAAKSASEKEKIVRKAGRIAPWVAGDRFIAAAKK